MPSPFPGIDPYVENMGIWRDFQLGLIGSCRSLLNLALPRNYVALADEEVSLVDLSGEATSSYRPDVMIAAQGYRANQAEGPKATARVATVDPVIVPVALKELDEIHDRWIEIRRLPERTLVSVIEILSPTNKCSLGRAQYLAKRSSLIGQPVHLVEIDLLLEGPRLPMAKPLPGGDFYAYVLRSESRPNAEVYAWAVRAGIPTVPIPLLAPDADVPLDLALACSQTYESGRYDDVIDYSAPLIVPLATAERAWAEGIARDSVSSPTYGPQ
jgi:hypothetical protein